jgi:hypothetical protein
MVAKIRKRGLVAGFWMPDTGYWMLETGMELSIGSN